MNIRYRDLSINDPFMKQELLEAVDKVFTHGKIILGPEVTEFENLVAKFCHTQHAVGVSCGTDALYLSLRVLGVGPGDEVITTPLSWIATLNAIFLTGATPVFVDIGKDLNINPDLIPDAITSKTKAIVPVHFTGRICKMDKIMNIAKKNNVFVVEDACQAYGAKLNGIISGAFGDLGCFSMNAMKVFCSYGEAGAVVTNSNEAYEKLLSYRYNGTINKEDCHTPGINARIDTIQAAMMNINLKYFDAIVERLRQISKYYNEELKNIVECPLEDESFHTYYSYTILIKKREKLVEYLQSKGVETKIQHPILMPYHTAYRDKYPMYELPVAEKLVDQILCIPNHSKLSDAEIEYVVSTLKGFYQ
jgi:dTDP-4-amino-4,6-dideoxygalactose transaminase